MKTSDKLKIAAQLRAVAQRLTADYGQAGEKEFGFLVEETVKHKVRYNVVAPDERTARKMAENGETTSEYLTGDDVVVNRAVVKLLK